MIYWGLHLAPYTLHPTTYILHPSPCTLHSSPYTLHPNSKSHTRAKGVEAVTQSSQSTELLLANKEMAAVQEKLEAKKVPEP